LILSSQPHIFFYAKRQGILFESLRPGEIGDLKKTVKDKHVTWVVFDERRGILQFPDLNYLIEPNSPLGWQLAFNKDDSPRILVWRVQN